MLVKCNQHNMISKDLIEDDTVFPTVPSICTPVKVNLFFTGQGNQILSSPYRFESVSGSFTAAAYKNNQIFPNELNRMLAKEDKNATSSCESGLGIYGLFNNGSTIPGIVTNEIPVLRYYIQFDFGNVTSKYNMISFYVASTQIGEGYQLYGSNSAGKIGTLFYTSPWDPKAKCPVVFPDSFGLQYRYVSITTIDIGALNGLKPNPLANIIVNSIIFACRAETSSKPSMTPTIELSPEPSLQPSQTPTFAPTCVGNITANLYNTNLGYQILDASLFSVDSMAGSFTAAAYVYNDQTIPNEMNRMVSKFSNNTGPCEYGLGIYGLYNNDTKIPIIVTNEIPIMSFYVQFDFVNISSQYGRISFTVGSTQLGEGYQLYGSDTAGVLGTNFYNSTWDPTGSCPNSLPYAFGKQYRYVSIVALDVGALNGMSPNKFANIIVKSVTFACGTIDVAPTSEPTCESTTESETDGSDNETDNPDHNFPSKAPAQKPTKKPKSPDDETDNPDHNSPSKDPIWKPTRKPVSSDDETDNEGSHHKSPSKKPVKRSPSRKPIRKLPSKKPEKNKTPSSRPIYKYPSSKPGINKTPSSRPIYKYPSSKPAKNKNPSSRPIYKYPSSKPLSTGGAKARSSSSANADSSSNTNTQSFDMAIGITIAVLMFVSMLAIILGIKYFHARRNKVYISNE